MEWKTRTLEELKCLMVTGLPDQYWNHDTSKSVQRLKQVVKYLSNGVGKKRNLMEEHWCSSLIKEKLDSQDLRRAGFEQQQSVDLLSKMLSSSISAPTTFHFSLFLLNIEILGIASEWWVWLRSPYLRSIMPYQDLSLAKDVGIWCLKKYRNRC